ncbi:GFA family protein [Candidatus Litorirhabdus singularis]|nr:GFA family protein [Candidatus Litorirhabdus singularis]
MENMATGGCLCGGYSYKFDQTQVISAHHCHCKDCQKMTGSGKATIIILPTALLESRGDIKFYTVTGTDGGHVSRGFCPECGCQMISYVEESPGLRFIKAGSLNDSSWVKIDSSFWSHSAEDWSPVDPRCPASEKNPEMG